MKRTKLVGFAIALCLIVPCMFGLTACNHTHTLTKVDAVSKTCTTAGNTAYYKCDCGKYFSDEKGEKEIKKDSWVVPAGHSFADTWSFNDTHHWKEATCTHSTEKAEYAEHSLTDNACACGYEVVQVKYTVDNVAEWNEVFTGDYLSNGTINCDNKYYVDDVLSPEESVTMIMKSTDSSMVMEMVDETQYLVKVDEVWYALSEIEGVWYGIQMDATFVESFTFQGSYGSAFVDKFDSFEYDEEHKCYASIEPIVLDQETTADSVKLYIENGKIVKMEIVILEDASSRGEAIYVFSNYGTTTIDIPEWTPMGIGE